MSNGSSGRWMYRVVCILILSYAAICLTTTASALFRLSKGALFGYAGGFWFTFDAWAHSSDVVLNIFLRTISISLAIVFVPGILCSWIVWLIILLVLLIIGFLFGLAVKLASISLTGAIIVYVAVAIIMAALLRKHWEAIIEAIAWSLAALKGIWHLIVPDFTQSSSTALQPAGGTVSVRRSRFDPDQVLPPDIKSPANIGDRLRQGLPNFTGRSQRKNVIAAKLDEINTKATTKALQAEADLLHTENMVYGYETEKGLREWKRGEQTANQFLNTQKAVDAMADYESDRAKKAQTQNQNPIDQEYAEQAIPIMRGKISKPVDELEMAVQREIEAAKRMKKQFQEIDANADFTPEEKELYKKRIRKRYESILGDAAADKE
jgi:hypothetical protein